MKNEFQKNSRSLSSGKSCVEADDKLVELDPELELELELESRSSSESESELSSSSQASNGTSGMVVS